MSFDINVKVTEDRKKTFLTFSPESGISGQLELDQAKLEGLINFLGSLRWMMAEGQKIPEISGAKLKPAHQYKWAVQKDSDKNESLLAFQHPGYGPVGFIFSDDQVKEYIKALQKSLKLKAAAKPKKTATAKTPK